MTDLQPGRTETIVTVLGGTDPTTIREALDVHVRIDALIGWSNDRKAEVRRWITERADQRREEDGAAPTWRLGDAGSVLQTDPQPNPRISDRETFARWYVSEVLDLDPDRTTTRYVEQFDDDVARLTVATCDALPLLRFLDEQATGHADDVAAAAGRLVNEIAVDTEWLLSEDLLERLIDGKDRAIDAGTPRLRVVEVKNPDSEWVVIDRATGEQVPGTTVAPPGARTVQVKPTPALKASVRAELDALIGQPTLVKGGTTQ